MRRWIEYAVENYRSKNSFGFQLADDLKARQIDMAIEQYARIVKPEEVVALLDTTVVRSGKSGFLFTDRYLYSSYEKEKEPIELMTLSRVVKRADNNSYCTLEYEDGRTREMYVSVFLDVVDILDMVIRRKADWKEEMEEDQTEKEQDELSDNHIIKEEFTILAEAVAEERVKFGIQEESSSMMRAKKSGIELSILEKAEERKTETGLSGIIESEIESEAETEPEEKNESDSDGGLAEEADIEIIGMEELEEEKLEESEEPVWDTELVQPFEQESEEPEEQEPYEQVLEKAKAGDREFMYKAAEMLYNGRQTASDSKEALRWFREAAKAEYVPAMLKLMQFYGEGELVKKNLTLSMSWAKKAAATGEPEGQYALAKAYIYGLAGTQDTDKGLKILDDMAEQGLETAGQMAAEVRQEIKKAKEHFDAGVRNPSTASGYYEMGIYCKKGDGYYSYPKEAVQYFRKAAEKEHVHAQYELALAYHNGEGVKKDETESIRWLEKAASKSHKEATELLEELLEKQKEKQEKAEFRHWLKQAEKGDGYAQSRIAELYLDGIGVKKDIQKGIEWYEKASETDEGYAARQLARLYTEGGLIPADEERAAYWRMVGGVLDEF